MVYRKPDERNKDEKKPRGRPFPKGHVKGKPRDEILDAEGHPGSDRRADIEEEKPECALHDMHHLVTQTTDTIIKENLSTPVPGKSTEELDEVDRIDFMNGSNKLTIRFSRRHNRMFRIQVILNDESEIRPVTYTGASTGYAFWNLLKGALKK